MIGLKMHSIETIQPDVITKPRTGAAESLQAANNPSSQQQKQDDEPVHWSDHSGLRCSFGLAEQ
jgi:hypothetical protein